jgi:hypothetical protein
MKPNDIITLTAFLSALSQLDEPLPANIQAKLNEIGKALAADPTNLGNLDVLAESYEPLDTVYHEELATLIVRLVNVIKLCLHFPYPANLLKN